MDEKEAFSAKQVQAAAGLSYRQINDWDEKGALPNERKAGRGWRRFTTREIFVLMVGAEFRRNLGTPLSKLEWLREWMLQDGANHVLAASEKMATLGVGIWIVTDFEQTFLMESELDLLDLMRMGFFGGDDEATYAWLKVNPLVNRLLESLPDAEPIESHGRGYEILQRVQATIQAQTRVEAFVLQSLREPEVVAVEVTLEGGTVRTVRKSKRHDAEKELKSLLSDHPFQTIKIIEKDGRVVSIETQSIFKPDEM